MKDEDVLDTGAPGASTLLFDEVKDAMSIFLAGNRSVCIVYGVDYRYLLEAHEHVAGDLVDGMVHLTVTYPP